MSYVGEDTIKLPEDADTEEVHERISEWRHHETERPYDIKEQRDRQIVLERVWRSACHYVVLCFAILVFLFLAIQVCRMIAWPYYALDTLVPIIVVIGL
ncbi:MAG: hypothetical protein ACQET3_11815, partial [Promethearchaeati archaeon]